MNIDPRYLDVLEWTDRMALLLTSIPTYKLADAALWREWADFVQSFPQIASFNPPNPHMFEDWREWATRFNQVVVL